MEKQIGQYTIRYTSVYHLFLLTSYINPSTFLNSKEHDEILIILMQRQNGIFQAENNEQIYQDLFYMVDHQIFSKHQIISHKTKSLTIEYEYINISYNEKQMLKNTYGKNYYSKLKNTKAILLSKAIEISNLFNRSYKGVFLNAIQNNTN